MKRTHRLFESRQITCNCHHKTIGTVLGFANSILRCTLLAIFIDESPQCREAPPAAGLTTPKDGEAR
jgi:hypothetical protein